jgi:hypothetical protein
MCLILCICVSVGLYVRACVCAGVCVYFDHPYSCEGGRSSTAAHSSIAHV